MKLKVGPLLGVESDERYTVCFLTDTAVETARVTVNDTDECPATCVGEIPAGKFWRAELTLDAAKHSRSVTYGINAGGTNVRDIHGRSSWSFYLPAAEESPRLAYASCNGFSSGDLATRTERPYLLWQQMREQHVNEPFALLLMGGDQLYADEIWAEVNELRKWRDLDAEDKLRRTASKLMIEQIDRFYCDLYCSRWRDENMSLMLASIPSVMMWDDHDIFDGWGSYPDRWQQCPVYKAIFETAKRYFELFQIRSKANASLLDREANHYAFGFRFRRYRILALDNRAERTRSRIISEAQWTKLIDHLDNEVMDSDLLVLSAVPVIYRDFSLVETSFDVTPWDEELTDDLKDHWRAKEHQGERARLIMRLLRNARDNKARARTVILSGDVHIGTLGVVNDTSQTETVKVHQVVSSGIVHPSPSRIQWLGIMAITNDDNEYLNEDKTIETRILHPFGSDKYIRRRNFVILKQGNDDKLWVTWESDSTDKPEYPLE